MYYIHMYLGWIIPADRILYSTFSYFLQQFIHSCTLHLSVLKSAIKGKKLSQWQLACKLQAIKRGTFECLGKLLLQDSRARGDYSLLFGEWQKKRAGRESLWQFAHHAIGIEIATWYRAIPRTVICGDNKHTRHEGYANLSSSKPNRQHI